MTGAPLVLQVVLKKIESGDDHGIEEVQVVNFKECMDTVSDNNLLVSDITASLGTLSTTM